jgi:hypothetical protein
VEYRIMTLARIGATFYTLWALLHVYAAWGTYSLAQSAEALLHHRVEQLAAYLLVISVVVLVFVPGNWRNAGTAYWVNLTLVTAADLIFILLVLLPSELPLVPGITGPVLWLIASGFSTAAYRPWAAHRREA